VQGAKQLQGLCGTATIASGAVAAAFAVFLALALFVFCLMAIMLLAKEYKSLFSCTKEDKGNGPLSNQFLIPTVAAMVMPPVVVALAFVEGEDLTGALHFNPLKTKKNYWQNVFVLQIKYFGLG
jgi:hypothetical protein